MPPPLVLLRTAGAGEAARWSALGPAPRWLGRGGGQCDGGAAGVGVRRVDGGAGRDALRSAGGPGVDALASAAVTAVAGCRGDGGGAYAYVMPTRWDAAAGPGLREGRRISLE